MRHTLFILDYFHPFIGGIETLFDAVTTFCSEKNMKVTVLTSRHSPDLKKIEKRGNVTIYRVGRNRFTTFFSVLGFVLNNRELIQSVDHIHTSTFTSSIPAWIVGKIYHKPTTITIHEIYNTLRYHLKGRKAIFYIWFEWIVCHLRWKKIITVSQSSKDMIQKTYPKLNHENVSVILNQIDTNFWNREQVNINQQDALKHVHNISVSDTLLLFVGRL